MKSVGSHTKRHAVIVGGSRGLGRGAVEEHLERGWLVTASVRKADALADVRSDRLSTVVLDTIDWPAIDAVAKVLTSPIDRLFVVAGETGPDCPIGDADPGAFAHVMLVNALAPLRIIDRWKHLISPRGLVAFMSSSMASISLNDTAGFESYRMSKATANVGLRSIAARLADDRTYIAINPGWVRTALGGADAELSVEESIRQVIDVLDRRDEDGGVHFLDFKDQTVPW